MDKGKVLIKLTPIDVMIIAGVLDMLENSFQDVPTITKAFKNFKEGSIDLLTIEQLIEATSEVYQMQQKILLMGRRN